MRAHSLASARRWCLHGLSKCVPVRTRGVLIVLAVLLAAIPGWAAEQTQAVPGVAPPRDPDAAVREMLQSPDPRQQAWGAWFAGRERKAAMIPLLIAVAVQHADASSLAERGARDIALDGLIELRAIVAPAVLARLAERTPAQALILAGTHLGAIEDPSDVSDVIVELLRTKPSGALWFGAANLLLAERHPALAAEVLSDLQFRIAVYVSDEGNVSGGGGAGAYGRSACGAAADHAIGTGLPPWAGYTLTTRMQPGVTVVSDGPVPVYYNRSVSVAGAWPPPALPDSEGPTTDQRLQYAAALARVEWQALDLRESESHAVKWTGQPALDAAIQEFRADLLRRLNGLVRTLVEGQRLDRDAAEAVRPVIDVRIHDERATRDSGY